MKPTTLILSLVAFLASSLLNAQEIESSESWPLVAEASSSSSSSSREKSLEEEFEELDGEIDDLEDIGSNEISDDEMFLDATLIEDEKPVKKKRRVRKVKKSKRPKRRVRKIVRKRKRPTRSRTVIAKLPPLPQKRSTLFHLSPIVGAAFFTVSGGLLDNSFSNSVTSDFGFKTGMLVEYRKDRSIWGIESGLIYMQNGAVGENNVFLTGTQGQIDYLLNEYLYIPLNAKIYPLRFNRFEMFIKAGVMGGFLMSSEFEGRNIFGQRISRDTSSFFKGQDVLGNIGLGARGKISRSFGVGLDVVYHKGLVDVSNAVTMANLTGGTFNLQETDNEAKNDGFSVSLSLVIDI